MLFTFIFGVLGVILVIGVETSPQLRDSPMLRVGGWFLGGALALVALAFLVAAL
ncbi:hypothetical protein [Rhabdothermincola sediminis]|uniref:hypothetical protein n=1 Tax=Rhabdothermincola sediminis TaxID=2751370 RepID=UPI001AA05F0E|nr:hypothetical protein [Rhabdothermincola sediminis]